MATRGRAGRYGRRQTEPRKRVTPAEEDKKIRKVIKDDMKPPKVAKPDKVKKLPVIVQKRAMLTNVRKTMEKSGISQDNIEIDCSFCPDAFLTAALGMISVLSARADAIDDRIYGFYVAFQNDLYANLTGAQVVLKTKLIYMSALFNCLRPKSIRTRYGDYKYSWTDVTSIGVVPKQINIRSSSYNFYKPAVIDPINVPQTCVPMSVASLDDAINDFNDLLTKIVDNKALLTATDYSIVKNYDNDVSAFSPSSPYLGAGSCSGAGVYTSAENELPCSSIPILAQFCTFKTPDRKSVV